MITEDYVSFETAKLLKEKGFDVYVKSYYNRAAEFNGNMALWNYNISEFRYSAPTLQMAMKWLREVHKLCISITPQVTDDDGDGGCLWQFAITSHLEPLSISLELYEQYEESCESAIKYALEKLI